MGSQQRFEYRRVRMGTEARIVLYSTNEQIARRAAEAAFSRIAAIEDVLSDYRTDSEVIVLRDAPVDTWIAVSDTLIEPLAVAESVREWTGGAFDVRCGRATDAWRGWRSVATAPKPFGPSSVGTLEVDIPASRIRLRAPIPWLDFGGIGKGWAADQAIHVLADHNVLQAMVDIGGDMSLGAPPPGSDGWRVGRLGLSQVWMLQHCGVATSGFQQQHIDVEDGAWSHLLDPRTGQWVGRHQDITVIAPTAALADALASAACVLGAEGLRTVIDGMDGIDVIEGACRP